VGRAPEMRHLSAVLARVEASSSEIITIDGEPGMGKSRLLVELANLAEGLGWTVVRCFGKDSTNGPGQGSAANAQAPGSVIQESLRNLPKPLREPLGDFDFDFDFDIDSDCGPSGRPAAVSEAVERLAATSPTLLLADDAQWLDDASLECLRILGCERRPPRLLIVSAFRFNTRKAVVEFRRACDGGGAPTLTLKPLVDSAAHELASATLGRDLTASDLEILSHTGGVPLRIRQMVAESPKPCRDLLNLAVTPVALTPFIGRESELGELHELLVSERLVTLVGTGGCGKTRLAQELSRRVESRYQGGTVWVELASRTDEPGVIGAIAAAVGVVEHDDAGLADLVVSNLTSRPPVLLVLDNAEHVLGATARLVNRLLIEVSNLCIVCTSREPLDVSGEWVWRIPTLRTPVAALTKELPLELIAEFDAVKLFVERAARVRRGFVLSPTNVEAVALICERLDGLPLAIELAAARVRAMSPERIASQLDDRLKLPGAVGQNVSSRHQTLHASIAWSESLLDDFERMVFRRLGVFVGGFTIEAAQAVGAGCANDQRLDNGSNIDPYEVADVVTRLVDKSLIVFDDPRDRFFMLETIRAFALERLEQTGELSQIRDVHSGWFAAWLGNLDEIANAEDAQQFIDRTPGWVQTIAPDVANCDAAFDWVETGSSISLRLTAGLGYYWLMTASYDEAVRYGLAATVAGDATSVEWGEAAMWLLGVLRNASLDGPAQLERKALAGGADFVGRPRIRLRGALMTTRIDQFGPTPDQLELFAQTRREAFELKDWYTFTNATYIPASVCAEFGMLREAEAINGGFVNQRTILVEALCSIRRGNFDNASRSVDAAFHMVEKDLSNMIVESFEVGFIEAELEILRGGSGERVLRLFPRLRLPSGPYENLGRMIEALCHIMTGDLPAAEQILTEPAASHYRLLASNAAAWLVRVKMALGDTVAARRTAELLLEKWGKLRAPFCESIAHVVLAECDFEEHPGDALAHAHDALSVASDYELWVGAVDALELIGTILVDLGRLPEGARLLGAAQGERDRMGYRHRFAHRAAYVGAAHAIARPTLGWAEGTTLTLGAAIELAQRMRGERVRPAVGWDSLTPTELQVAEAVIRGLTNPQVGEALFISRATVKTHLVHIFGKLNVRNRTEMATLYRSMMPTNENNEPG
jgi:predicted ATPase/DNA-binding CsgD family transcriptional regulator